MIKLAVTGAAGRMGRSIIQAVHASPEVELSCALEHPGADAVGVDAGVAAGVGAIGVEIGAELSAQEFDVLIDFTAPAATIAFESTFIHWKWTS